MSQGPFFTVKPHYALTLETAPEYAKDDNGRVIYDEYNEPTLLDGSSFVVRAHVKKLSGNEAERLGLDRTKLNLELLCADPMEGDSRVTGGSRCSLSFMGKSGTVTIQAVPNERLHDVVEAIGVKYWGTFES